MVEFIKNNNIIIIKINNKMNLHQLKIAKNNKF